MVRADFYEEHASSSRFPLDIPRRRVLPFPPSRESVLPSMPYVYPALHNPKDSSQILFPQVPRFWNEFSLRAEERPFSASNGTRGTALHSLDINGVTVLHWSWWRMSTSKRGARPNKRNNGEQAFDSRLLHFYVLPYCSSGRVLGNTRRVLLILKSFPMYYGWYGIGLERTIPFQWCYRRKSLFSNLFLTRRVRWCKQANEDT